MKKLFYIFIFIHFLYCLSQPIHNTTYKRVQCNENYFLVNHLCEDEKEYIDWAENYPDLLHLSEIQDENLKELTRKYSDIDKAAILFFHRVLNDPKNKKFLDSIIEKKNIFEKTQNFNFNPKDFLFVFVPGMFYKDNPQTQADGREIRKLLAQKNIESLLLEVDQTGSIQKNGKQICYFLEENQKSKKKIVFVSPSKGSSDIKAAFYQCSDKEYFEYVKGWINISGLIKGTYIVDYLNSHFLDSLKLRIYFLFKNYSWEGLQSIRRKDNPILEKEIKLPQHVKMINIVGVPLFRHVSQFAKPYYLYLAQYGPNDGYILLADTIVPGSYILPLLRNDHYYLWGVEDSLILSIAAFIMED